MYPFSPVKFCYWDETGRQAEGEETWWMLSVLITVASVAAGCSRSSWYQLPTFFSPRTSLLVPCMGNQHQLSCILSPRFTKDPLQASKSQWSPLLPLFPTWRWWLLPMFATSVLSLGLPRWLSGKEPTCQCKRCRRQEFDPWIGKIPWSRKWHPLQYSCLENSMGRGTWWVMVHGVTESQTGLSMHTCFLRAPLSSFLYFFNQVPVFSYLLK